MMSAALGARQLRFIDEYLVDCNGARAAVAAGYARAGAAVAAHRLLSNANVATTIRARQAVDTTRLGLAREDVLAGLLEAVERARQQGNPMGMISGLREIGRLLGFYAPHCVRLDLESKIRSDVERLERLSDDQLLAIIQGAAAVPEPDDLAAG